jgi:hypothetical protein
MTQISAFFDSLKFFLSLGEVFSSLLSVSSELKDLFGNFPKK